MEERVGPFTYLEHMKNEELILRIEALNDYSDTRELWKLCDQLVWMNTADPANDRVFEAARKKNLI